MSFIRASKQQGFTIVELLIVIVVIGILAAITIVSYNGITARADFSKMQSDLSSLNKAIQLYYADNGLYPITPDGTTSCYSGYWCGWNRATGDNFIPGLSPKYISQTPQLKSSGSAAETYLYRSPNGQDYKLIRLTGLSTGLPAVERNGSTFNTSQVDRWGYWSSENSRYW